MLSVYVLVLSSLVAAPLCTPAVSRAAAPIPVVQGNHLIDSTTGAVWVPRGVNWPSFEYACQQGWAYSRDSANPATVAAMAAWHINAVRIGLNQDCWLGDDGLPSNPGGTAQGYRAAVKKFSDALQSAGIVPILDLHWTGPDGVVADGQRAMPDDRTDDFWSSVAAAYKDDRSVMFDAFNEPYSRVDSATGFDFTLTWDCWKNGGISCGAGAPAQHDRQHPFDGHRFVVTGMAALVRAIRSAGATQPIMLGGLDYANDLTGWLANRPDDGQLVASFHNYQFNRCKDARCWDAEIAPVARTVPVVTGEFGASDCNDTHDKAYMTWADEHDVGYLAWAWWVLDAPSDGSSACSQLALLKADGTARFPNGTALKDHLANLAAANPRGPQPASTVPTHPVQFTTQLASTVPTHPVQFTKNTVFTVGDATSRYWIYVPSVYDETHRTPIRLFVWLHGCGGKSQFDISNVSVGGDQTYIAIAPGGREGGCWDVEADPARVLAAVADVKTHFNIDPRRVVLGGYSSGGNLAYRTAFYNSRMFAGVLAENTSPFSHTGSTQAASLAAASWKFHVVHLAHLADDTFPIAMVRTETDAMKAAGFPIERIERAGGHYDPDTATSGTEHDVRTLLLPHLNDDWLAPDTGARDRAM